MSEQDRHVELQQKTQQLLRGSLKHVRAAALAAALVPLATVAAQTPVPRQFSSGGATVPSPCDFVTSGGFVRTDTGQHASFGAHGGCKNGGFWGHVNYVDHATGYHISSVEITGYLTPDSAGTTRDICGLATTNAAESQPVQFRVRLIDNGEPGVADFFGIRLSNGYVVSSRLLNNGQGGGGNVQLHKGNRSNTAPNPVPSEAMMCGGVEAP